MIASNYNLKHTTNKIYTPSGVMILFAWIVLFAVANNCGNNPTPYIIGLIIAQLYPFVKFREVPSKWIILCHVGFTGFAWYYLNKDFNNVVFFQSAFGIVYYLVCARVLFKKCKDVRFEYILLHAVFFIYAYLLFMMMIYKVHVNHPLEISLALIGAYLFFACLISDYLPKPFYQYVDLYFEKFPRILDFIRSALTERNNIVEKIILKVLLKVKKLSVNNDRLIHKSDEIVVTHQNKPDSNPNCSQQLNTVNPHKQLSEGHYTKELSRIDQNARDNHESISILMDNIKLGS